MITASAALSGLEDLLKNLQAPEAEESPDQPSDVAPDAGDVTDNASQTADADTVVEQPKPMSKRASSNGKGKGKPAADKKPKSKRKAKPKDESAEAPSDAAPEVPPPAVEASANPEPKPEPQKRIFWGRDKIGRLQHKLGAEVEKFFLFDTEDMDLEGDALAAKIAENKTAFKESAVKVQNRATGLIELVSGKSDRLNPVMGLVLRLLAKDRVLTTGDAGSIHKTLIAANYSKDAARAMGNSTLGALRALHVVKLGDKQVYVPNERSVFLALISEKLGLSFIDVEASIEEEDAREAARIAAAKEALKGKMKLPDAPKEEAKQEQAPETPKQGAAPDATAGDDAVASLIDGIIEDASKEQLGQLEVTLY